MLGCDVGTSSTKSAIYDIKGNILGSSESEYSISYPRPTWAEADPELWWNAAKMTIRGAIRQAKVDGSEIVGISVSGLAPDCVPIDKGGKPVRPAILWIDRRATRECEWIKENIGADKVRQISGNTIDTYFAGPKWLWFKNNEPKLFKKTWKILQGHSYIIYRMTREAVTDFSHGGMCAPNFDLFRKKWSEEVCETTGISIEVLPSLYSSHKIIGEVTEEGAKQTSLKKGTPVVAGGGDFACSTLGSGVISAGEACQMLGTAGNILIPVGRTIKPDPRLINTVHVTGDYLTLGSMFAGGILRWFRDELAPLEAETAINAHTSPYALLDRKVQEIPPGAEGMIVLPYFMGERTPIWDPYARGLFLGITAYHTRLHMYRAILEGIAYGFLHMIEIAKEAGVNVREIVSVNGGAKSKLWRQIFADVLGIPIAYCAKGGGATMGDSFLAGVGTGHLKSFNSVKEWVLITDSTRPRREAHSTYLRYYRLYRRVYEHLKSDLAELSLLS